MCLRSACSTADILSVFVGIGIVYCRVDSPIVRAEASPVKRNSRKKEKEKNVLDPRPRLAIVGGEPMSTDHAPTSNTVPADLTPDQIAAALCELAKRDNVAIFARTHCGEPISFQVVEVETESGKFLGRTGVAATYDAALAACRNAKFTGAESK